MPPPITIRIGGTAQRPETIGVSPMNFGLFGHRSGAQGGAGKDDLFDYDQMHRDLRLGAFLNRDLHQPAAFRQRIQVARHIVAAHHIEHQVDAFATGDVFYRGDEILFAVIDGPVRAQFFAGLAFFSRSGGDQPREGTKVARLRSQEPRRIREERSKSRQGNARSPKSHRYS